MRNIKHRAIAAATALTIAAASSTAASPSASADSAACPELYVIGVHGAGERATSKDLYMGPTVVKFWYKLVQKSAGRITLGHAGVGYAAPDILSLIKETASSKEVANSVRNGSTELARLVKQHLDSCPPASNDEALDSDIVLVGYSQGAWVVNHFLKNNPTQATQIEGGVLLFGDPQYDSSSNYTHQNGAKTVTGIGLARWGAWLFARPINPYMPLGSDPASKELRGFSASYCFRNLLLTDPVCHAGGTLVQMLANVPAHFMYANKGGPMDQAIAAMEKNHIIVTP